jgi:hypothetical protein
MAKKPKEIVEFKKRDVTVRYPLDFADRNEALLKADGWVRQVDIPNLKIETNEPNL